MTTPPPAHNDIYWPRRTTIADATLERLQAFADNWVGKSGNEQQLAQAFLLDLCDALGTARPYGPDAPTAADYGFERRVHGPGGHDSGRIDLYKKGHFILEAKCGSSTPHDGGGPRRGTMQWLNYIEGAYADQARVYATNLAEDLPPLLIVVDIGWHFWIWRQREGRFDAFGSPDRIDFPLKDIADEPNAHALWAAFEAPSELDPSRRQERITQQAATQLAGLAAELNDEHGAEPVARFLMRAMFCMFAEDVGLLPHAHFTNLLRKSLKLPQVFEPECTALFRQMDTGGTHDFQVIRRFNGELFLDARALRLSGTQLQRLADAASLDWSEVDPAIFGTLIERALDPKERHRLGAHYTPRSFVERIVRVAVEDPLRQDWELVRAQVAEEQQAVEPLRDELQTLRDAADGGRRGLSGDELRRAEELRAKIGSADARAAKHVEAFQQTLAKIRVLDPACGTGNFLYVSYELLKSLEHEVLDALHRLQPQQYGLELSADAQAIVPEHFLGIELKPWAADIAQLVLWIGHIRWVLKHRHKSDAAADPASAAHPRIHLGEPILPTIRTIECRDALIACTREQVRLGPDGEPQTRWDGESTIEHPVTRKQVPDPQARTPIYDYIGAKKARWPRADFVVGNPPFLGNKHMREALGDGYVETVRRVYADVPDTVDYVMYWWHRAAERTRKKELRRFGLITTNSLPQTFNRQVTTAHLQAKPALRLVMAIADHPWVDKGAAVRISMSIGEHRKPRGKMAAARLGTVTAESAGHEEVVVQYRPVSTIHADLTGGANVAAAVPLKANEGLSFQGMNLVGKGFRLTPEQVEALGFDLDDLPPIIRPYLNAREFMQRPQGRYVIDAFGYTADSLREAYPTAYQWLYDHVKPERDENRRKSRREKWWLFGETVGKLRKAMDGLERYIATPETSKHRVFRTFPLALCPDHTLYAFALQGDFELGVLSSRVHLAWSLHAGGTLEDRPRYNNQRCFGAFPFPLVSDNAAVRIESTAGALNEHREAAMQRCEALTYTKLYNLVDKLRAGERLSAAESTLHTQAATSELVRLHDELDKAVLDAYGWPHDIADEELLERLVALNAERAAEEAQGTIRRLRRDASERTQLHSGPAADLFGPGDGAADKPDGPEPWPADPIDQLAAVLAVVPSSAQPPADAEAIAQAFVRAPRKKVASILERLAERRLIRQLPDSRYCAL